MNSNIDKGLMEYVKYLNDGKDVAHPVIYFKKEDPASRLIVEVAHAIQRRLQRDHPDPSPTTSTRTKAARI